jgi:hypothetical protein
MSPTAAAFRLKAEATLTLMRIRSLPPEGGSRADDDKHPQLPPEGGSHADADENLQPSA